jgi:PAS domain S-box-containing protein
MSLADPAFRAIFENAAIGIAVVDRDLKVVDVNFAYCEMLGYTKDELLAMRLVDYTHPEDQKRDVEFLALLFAGRIPNYRAEKRYITKRGETLWGSLKAEVIRDATGQPSLVFGMVENITERKILHKILPLCPSCKRVRNEKGFWDDVEVFLENHAATHVAHGLCPDCLRKGAAS